MKVIILGSGSKGNATLLITKTKKILIDAGFSLIRIKRSLEKYDYKLEEIDFILLTHEHNDHIAGLASIVKKYQKLVYIPGKMSKVINRFIDRDSLILIDERDFIVDDVSIRFLPTSHDAIASVGFLIESYNESLVYITDTGYINARNLQCMHNKQLYIIESNHDPIMLMEGPYPYILKQRVLSMKGHLSNEMTGNYLDKIIGNDTKKIILAHISETNNLESLAIETVSSIINKHNVPIEAAKQDIEMVIEV